MSNTDKKKTVDVKDEYLEDFICCKCQHKGMKVRLDTPPFDVATCPNCGHEATISYGTEKGSVI